MSMTLDAGKTGKTDLFFIDPAFIIVEDSRNSRKDPHDDDVIDDMARSLLTHGQIQPVVLRKVKPGHKVEVLARFRRIRAALRINAAHADGTLAEKYPDLEVISPPVLPFVLQCRVIECNDLEAYCKGIQENHQRSNLTPIDYAHQIRTFHEDHGWEIGKIATFYGYTKARISQLQPLVRLPEDVQEAVASGDIGERAMAGRYEGAVGE